MARTLVIITMVLLSASGCGPRATWVRNPGPNDNGLRYYRPKPYILLTPASAAAEAEGSKSAGTDVRICTYKLSLCFLPDFCEEYSVHLRPGLGASKLSVTLENGWNLTSINQDLDSKVADNVNAAANLIKCVIPGGALPATGEKSKEVGGGQSRDPGSATIPPALPDAFVRGHEVPIGYYEAVIDRDPRVGVKRLLGFRYIGFLPFTQVPPVPGIAYPSCADDEAGLLYGLVLEKGVLIFKVLSAMKAPVDIPVPASAAHAEAGGSLDPKNKLAAVTTSVGNDSRRNKPHTTHGESGKKPLTPPESMLPTLPGLDPVSP